MCGELLKRFMCMEINALKLDCALWNKRLKRHEVVEIVYVNIFLCSRFFTPFISFPVLPTVVKIWVCWKVYNLQAPSVDGNLLFLHANVVQECAATEQRSVRSCMWQRLIQGVFLWFRLCTRASLSLWVLTVTFDILSSTVWVKHVYTEGIWKYSCNYIYSLSCESTAEATCYI